MAAFRRLDDALPEMDAAAIKAQMREIGQVREEVLAQLDGDDGRRRKKLLDLVDALDQATMLCEQFVSGGGTPCAILYLLVS